MNSPILWQSTCRYSLDLLKLQLNNRPVTINIIFFFDKVKHYHINSRLVVLLRENDRPKCMVRKHPIWKNLMFSQSICQWLGSRNLKESTRPDSLITNRDFLKYHLIWKIALLATEKAVHLTDSLIMQNILVLIWIFLLYKSLEQFSIHYFYFTNSVIFPELAFQCLSAIFKAARRNHGKVWLRGN